MDLMATLIRANVATGMAESLHRMGFKTEARNLKAQANEVTKIILKFVGELPKLSPPSGGVFDILSGKVTLAQVKETRRKRGKVFSDIGKAETTMLHTARRAMDSLYKEHKDWSKQQRVAATQRMMKGLHETPVKTAKKYLLEAPK